MSLSACCCLLNAFLAGGFLKRAMAGTLEYMAPEVLLKRPASQASDVYGLAIAINELATGEHAELLLRIFAVGSMVRYTAAQLVDVLYGLATAINELATGVLLAMMWCRLAYV
jgi:serine/threonine protein kinase